MENLLRLLEENSRLTHKDISDILGVEESEIKKKISEYENDGTILAYKTVLDYEKLDDNLVTAFIHLKLTPQKGCGFDEIAKKIHNYPQVRSVYLMSGGFDLSITIVGKSMKEIAFFVSSEVATIEGVLSTETHFLLKKYKEQGTTFCKPYSDERQVLL